MLSYMLPNGHTLELHHNDKLFGTGESTLDAVNGTMVPVSSSTTNDTSSTSKDPSSVSVRWDHGLVAFSEFVFDTAVRWKSGNDSLYMELLTVLLNNMMGGKTPSQEGKNSTQLELETDRQAQAGDNNTDDVKLEPKLETIAMESEKEFVKCPKCCVELLGVEDIRIHQNSCGFIFSLDALRTAESNKTSSMINQTSAEKFKCPKCGYCPRKSLRPGRPKGSVRRPRRKQRRGASDSEDNRDDNENENFQDMEDERDNSVEARGQVGIEINNEDMSKVGRKGRASKAVCKEMFEPLDQPLPIIVQCELCDSKFDNLANLAQHLATLHKKEEEEAALKREAEDVNEEKDLRYICRICKKDIEPSQDSRKRGSPSDNGQIESRIYTSLADLQLHLRSDHGLDSMTHFDYETIAGTSHQDKDEDMTVDDDRSDESDDGGDQHQPVSGGQHYADRNKRRVQCDRCDQTFCSRSSFKTHVRVVHENIRDFVCRNCGAEFSTLSGVKRHISYSHQLDPSDEHIERRHTEIDITRYICFECNLDLASRDGLTRHVVELHPTRPDLFPEIVRKRGPLPWSRLEAWERGDWICPICPEDLLFKTDTLNGMVSHMKQAHSDLALCWVCGQHWPAEDRKKVYEHMVERHPLKALFACKECGVYHNSKKVLGGHIKIHRMEEFQGPLLSCDQCDYTTMRPDLMSKHRFSHKAAKSLMCDDCGKVLGSRAALATHARLHLKDEAKHKCKFCQKTFTQRGYLRTHLNSHLDTKPFSCEFCAMSFTGPTNLSQHRKRAHGDLIGESPQLNCDLCSKRFWIPSELKYHMERVHQGKRDFSCNECLKRFTDQKSLKKHLVGVHKHPPSPVRPELYL